MRQISNLHRGFTIIELLIVFSVIAIISTIGVASFSTYSRSQTLQQAGNDIITNLNLAKNSASSQVKVFNVNGGTIQCPANTVLNGYSFTLNISSNNYSLNLVCSGSTIPATSTTKLPNGVTFSPASDPTNPTTTTNVFFNVLTGGVTGSGNIALTGQGGQECISINAAGLVQQQQPTCKVINPTSTPTVAPTSTSTPTVAPTVSPSPTPVCTNGYVDNDKDGYGAGSYGCYPPSVSYNVVSNNTDCYDSNPNAHPGQIAWFSTNRGDGSFDYNCDGITESVLNTQNLGFLIACVGTGNTNITMGSMITSASTCPPGGFTKSFWGGSYQVSGTGLNCDGSQFYSTYVSGAPNSVAYCSNFTGTTLYQ